MKTGDIISDITAKVLDASFTSDTILDLINEARYFIAANVDLPALRTSSEVETTSTESEVDLPDDYHRDIFWVGSEAQGRRIGERQGDYYNLLTFDEVYPITEGNIEAVCVDGSVLKYRGMADDTLTIKYYKTPVVITDTDDSPDELPVHLQRPLLTAYCCREIFSSIEDGIEGEKVNTAYWGAKFSEYMGALNSWVSTNKPREPKRVREAYE